MTIEHRYIVVNDKGEIVSRDNFEHEARKVAALQAHLYNDTPFYVFEKVASALEKSNVSWTEHRHNLKGSEAYSVNECAQAMTEDSVTKKR